MTHYPWGVCPATFEGMHSVIGNGRRGAAASATGLLIALTVFGVLLMHSATPTPPMTGPMSSPMSSGHVSLGSTSTSASSVPVAYGEHDCPSEHQMMHPCLGTPVSGPALTAPTTNAAIDLTPISVNRIVGRADSTLERAPPWTLWELDRSVTLRV